METPILDERKVWYLVLHVGGTSSTPGAPNDVSSHIATAARRRGVRHVTPRAVERMAKRVAKTVGIQLRLLPVGSSGHCYFFFRFQRYKRRDQQAQKFAESFVYAVELLHGPIINEDQPIFAFRVPVSLMREPTRLTFDRLRRVEEARSYKQRRIPFPHSLGTACFIPAFGVEAAWRIVPIIYRNDNIRRALAFYSESQHEFYVSPGEFREVLYEGDVPPETSKVQTRRENAFQNAFKAIEAVIGDPPKDAEKFRARLRAIGVNPSEPVGYRTKRKIETEIREMNRIRDKRAAHGSTRNRELTAMEVLSYQECAGYIVQAGIEKALGHAIYTENLTSS